MINAIKKINKQVIKDVNIFDLFKGGNLPADKISIALKIILQPIDKTFTDKEIEEISYSIIELVSNSFDGELRQ